MKETKRQGRKLVRPLVNVLAAGRVSPNLVTVLALPFNIAACVLLAQGRFLWGGIAVALGGLCDTLDGELSRVSGRASRAGAVLDSVADRVGESLVLVGLYWYYQSVNPWYARLTVAALVLSLMVSYVRARAEGAGYECTVGWFERPVRVLVILVGLFVLGRTWTPLALAVIAAGSLVTVVHRTAHVLRQSNRPSSGQDTRFGRPS